MPPLSMRKFLVISLLVLLVAPLALLGSAYVFRDSLLQAGAGRLLAERDMEITRLQGLQLHTNRITLDTLNVQLSSGLQLDISAIEVHFSFTEFPGMPLIEAVVLDTARLYATENPQGIDSGGPAATANTSAMQLSEVLALLREFPVAAVDINSLTLLQSREPLALTLQHQAGEMEVQLHSGPWQLGLEFSQPDMAAAARFQVRLVHNAVTVGTVLANLAPEQGRYRLDGRGHLTIADIATIREDLQDSTSISLPEGSIALDWELAGSVADAITEVIAGSASPGMPEGFEVRLQQGGMLSLSAQLIAGLGELTLVLSDNATMVFTPGAGFNIITGSLPVMLSTSWQDQPAGMDSVLTLTDCSLTALTPCLIGFNGNAHYGTYGLSGSLAIVAPGLAAAPGNYRASSTDLVLDGLSGWYPAFDLDASITLAPDSLGFSSPLVLRGAHVSAGLLARGNYDLLTGAASMQVSLPPHDFAEPDSALSALVPGWPLPLDLLSGELAAELDLHWQPPVSGAGAGQLAASMTASLDNIGGYYQEYFFRGLSSDLQIAMDYAGNNNTMKLAIPPVTLTMAGIDMGLPMENLAVQLQLDRNTQQIEIASFYAQALGGEFTGAGVNYDFKRARNDIVLQFAGLNLEQMLALVQYDAVQATGTIDGELPITLTATGVEVMAGTLHANAPGGSIRYLKGAEAGLQGNAGLDLVNKALGNYQFTSMTSSINYSPVGELLLTMQLKGYNPDMDKDQPINLNLSLSDNIPALMKSLRAARAIEDFLELRYQ